MNVNLVKTIIKVIQWIILSPIIVFVIIIGGAPLVVALIIAWANDLLCYPDYDYNFWELIDYNWTEEISTIYFFCFLGWVPVLALLSGKVISIIL